jgi:hypothetical protein
MAIRAARIGACAFLVACTKLDGLSGGSEDAGADVVTDASTESDAPVDSGGPCVSGDAVVGIEAFDGHHSPRRPWARRVT